MLKGKYTIFLSSINISIEKSYAAAIFFARERNDVKTGQRYHVK